MRSGAYVILFFTYFTLSSLAKGLKFSFHIITFPDTNVTKIDTAKDLSADWSVARTALVFINEGNSLKRIAICASYDVDPIKEDGVWSETFPASML